MKNMVNYISFSGHQEKLHMFSGKPRSTIYFCMKDKAKYVGFNENHGELYMFSSQRRPTIFCMINKGNFT